VPNSPISPDNENKVGPAFHICTHRDMYPEQTYEWGSECCLPVFTPRMSVNLNREYKLLKFFEDIGLMYAQSSSQNQRLVHLVSLILTAGLLFLALPQIGVAQTIHIPDSNLRAALESALGKEADAGITRAEMAGLEVLDASESGVLDLTGLEFAINLTGVYLGLNRISDVSPLQDLINLTVLDLHRNRGISDVSPLKGLTKLTWLSLRGNRIVDVSPLKDLTKLTYLHLGYNGISDVSPLKTLTNLTFLNLDANRISDVSPLKTLTNLTNLALDDNQLSDVSPLKDLTNLKFLNLNDNQLSDVSPLKDLTNLKFIDLHGNQLSDVSPLKGLTNLTNLRLQENRISDVSPLKNLTKLTRLVLRSNHILDFSAIAGLIENLVEYDISYQTALSVKSEDVNRDGVVNIIDLVLVASHFQGADLATLAQSGIHPDVNDDGVVNISDLVLIAAGLSPAAAAPMLRENPTEVSSLTAEDLTEWIQLAKQFDTQKLQTQKGIIVLEHFLAVLNAVETLPEVTALLANYPNPFNPETWLPYQLSEDANVQIRIYSSVGHLVRTLDLGFQNSGFYLRKDSAAYWDGRNDVGERLASGVYFYQLIAGDYTAIRRLVIRK